MADGKRAAESEDLEDLRAKITLQTREIIALTERAHKRHADLLRAQATALDYRSELMAIASRALDWRSPSAQVVHLGEAGGAAANLYAMAEAALDRLSLGGPILEAIDGYAELVEHERSCTACAEGDGPCEQWSIRKATANLALERVLDHQAWRGRRRILSHALPADPIREAERAACEQTVKDLLQGGVLEGPGEREYALRFLVYEPLEGRESPGIEDPAFRGDPTTEWLRALGVAALRALRARQRTGAP